MKRTILLFFTILLPSMIYGQSMIRINQIGFYPSAQKIAVIESQNSIQFNVVNLQNEQTVYTGTTSAASVWQPSGESVVKADFTDLQTPGMYKIETETGQESVPFEIADHIHSKLAIASLKAYYFNRVSTELPDEYADKWSRPEGHPDDQVSIHPSAESTARPAGTIISAPKGWYDAGDYNKYVVNSGISTYTLLAAWEHFPGFYNELETNIPESGNDLPDILDEVKWNLDWMLDMQDPNDGGVYHKLSSPNFSGKVMPHQDQDSRIVVMKSTTAALDFAAVMAVASRVFEEFDQAYAQRCLDAALDAWNWALDHPDVPYRQPADVSTGEYGDSQFQDEFDWAAAELFITTGNNDFWNARNFRRTSMGVPSWQYVRPLTWISLAHHREDLGSAADISLIEERINQQAQALWQASEESAYGISMGENSGDFVWGSNSVALNQAMVLLQGYKVAKDKKYLEAALANLDYIMGRNATEFSFVTGFGEQSPMDPHHRQSAADNVSEPVPGFVVGGPHNGQQDGCDYPSDMPAKSYLDDWCSFSTNEVTINWNAPLVYVTGALEFFFTRQTTTSITEDPDVEHTFLLAQNYPNPFNPSTNITYQLPKTGKVSIIVYDFLGRKVKTLLNNVQRAGKHTVVFDAESLSSGIYIYQIRGESFHTTQKMTLIK